MARSIICFTWTSAILLLFLEDVTWDRLIYHTFLLLYLWRLFRLGDIEWVFLLYKRLDFYETYRRYDDYSLRTIKGEKTNSAFRHVKRTILPHVSTAEPDAIDACEIIGKGYSLDVNNAESRVSSVCTIHFPRILKHTRNKGEWRGLVILKLWKKLRAVAIIILREWVAPSQLQIFINPERICKKIGQCGQKVHQADYIIALKATISLLRYLSQSRANMNEQLHYISNACISCWPAIVTKKLLWYDMNLF